MKSVAFLFDVMILLKVSVSGADQILDLGYIIKAIESGGLGHGKLIRNEGRWCL